MKIGTLTRVRAAVKTTWIVPVKEFLINLAFDKAGGNDLNLFNRNIP
jgi:hypothetical protein